MAVTDVWINATLGNLEDNGWEGTDAEAERVLSLPRGRMSEYRRRYPKNARTRPLAEVQQEVADAETPAKS